jgi:hypothetical protein
MASQKPPHDAILWAQLLLDPWWKGRPRMRYLVAWLLGVPLSLIALWYLVGHAACG